MNNARMYNYNILQNTYVGNHFHVVRWTREEVEAMAIPEGK